MDRPPESFRFRLNGNSGVPVYRQLIDQVQAAIASGSLRSGEQLPTVRLVAVELAINPNTVMRAYRELEIRGVLDTQQGTGTFVADRPSEPHPDRKQQQLTELAHECAARAGTAGLTLNELIAALQQLANDGAHRRTS